MATVVLEKESLDRQADRIERALLGLSLPVRIQGGEVARGWVRYHLTPVAGTPVARVSEAAGAVAEAIGVAQVRVAQVEDGLALDVPMPSSRPLRLLPLLQAIGPLPAQTGVVGLDEQGHVLLFRLTHRDTVHLLAVGGEGAGKSELLRTLAVSLAWTTPTSGLRLAGIDVGGRELAVLEALPHMARDLATDPSAALETLVWLMQEMERRQPHRLVTPHVVLIVDDLQWLTREGRAEALGLLGDLVRTGAGVGIHILASARPETLAMLGRPLAAPGMVRAEGLGFPAGNRNGTAAGRFRFRCGGEKISARAAWLSVRDLDRVARMIGTDEREMPGVGLGSPTGSEQEQ